MNIWLAVIPIIISVISLYFSIKATLRQVPKLEISLVDELINACYGGTHVSEDNTPTSYAAYVNLRLYNKSLTPVTISEVRLKVDNTYYELADRTLPYWSNVIFYYMQDGECTYNGSSISYSQNKIEFPFALNGYESKDLKCVFLHFPNLNKPKVKVKIEFDTGAGRVSKGIELFYYDEEFTHREWEDFEKYDKSR